MQELQDEITLHSSPLERGSNDPAKRLLIFFICGNPGLIEYYRAFLEEIQHQLQADGQAKNVILYGASHDGFEIHPSTKRKPAHAPPFSLQEEIESVQRRLQEKAEELAESGGPIDVVLMGHSVGSYMLLEVITWWQRQREQQALYRIVGGVCLFPTVVDIAKSSKGRSLSWLLGLPFMPGFLQFVARCVASIPTSWINWPRLLNPGTEGIAVTEAMIRSRHSVRQIIHMANQEMHEIKEDKWHPANLWGLLPHEYDFDGADTSTTETHDAPRTRLFFYWGNDDYWVNNDSRDSLIASRAQTSDKKTHSRAKMMIDQSDIPHPFSMETKHTKIVAAHVAEFIGELREQLAAQT
ncbi:unnamed protein product [Zymoseptoria tritici ST99CH_3D7]|uniref:AB hydrolase-1 domain-containing protein n=1 Tax=Zymoseptoria tritici (strain ST99CH_3D7) TaxID=1276538 RepID=A0A1X7S297_ZYMT9|nr:unnamed protein product [Zymoseptoria tritici ST99CH_3D7]